eukprot:XP_001710059.1 Hypothetical protein GL50803_34981 [Giardia lamblia ATCC 50803]
MFNGRNGLLLVEEERGSQQQKLMNYALIFRDQLYLLTKIHCIIRIGVVVIGRLNRAVTCKG